MKEAFDLFDTEGRNQIDAKEIRVALRALGFKESREEVKKMLEAADQTDAQSISYEDFTKMVAVKMMSRDPKEEIMLAFAYFAGLDTSQPDPKKRMNPLLSYEEDDKGVAHALPFDYVSRASKPLANCS